jgi:hypothetical protein
MVRQIYGGDMKVYGVNLDGRYRGIVAAKNKTQAAKLFGTSIYHFNQFGCETGNKEEIKIAMKQPGIVWKQSISSTEWVLA